MKTAISIPDELFAAGDRLARQLGVSRSELYARALERYLAGGTDAEVTARINAAIEGMDTSLDPDLEHASLEALRRDP